MEKKNQLDLQLFAQEEGQVIPEANREQRIDETLEQRFITHLEELQRQAAALKAVFPGLDLQQELKNPVFVRLTAPGVGLSVEDAYYAVHRKELQAAAMAAAQAQVSQAIASGAMRPRENGLSGQAPAVSTFDYRSATKEQREELKKRIRQAAADGRKVYPGR